MIVHMLADGVKLLTVRADTQLARHLAAYCLIRKDLESTRAAISELLARVGAPNTVTWALFIALVTTYGKCFVGAEGRLVKLEKNHVPLEHRNTHACLMDLRNKYTAHSGGTNSEIAAMLIGLNPDRSNPFVVAAASFSGIAVCPGREELSKYLALVDAVAAKVDDIIEEKNRQFQTWIETQDPQNLYSLKS